MDINQIDIRLSCLDCYDIGRWRNEDRQADRSVILV